MCSGWLIPLQAFSRSYFTAILDISDMITQGLHLWSLYGFHHESVDIFVTFVLPLIEFSEPWLVANHTHTRWPTMLCEASWVLRPCPRDTIWGHLVWLMTKIPQTWRAINAYWIQTFRIHLLECLSDEVIASKLQCIFTPSSNRS